MQNSKMLKLLKTKTMLYSMYGVLGASLFGGYYKNIKKFDLVSLPTISKTFTGEVVEEKEDEDIVDYIVDRYNKLSDEPITKEDVGKIEVGQATLFMEDEKVIFDPSLPYDFDNDYIERERTKGIVTFINRKNKKAIASIGYVDKNLTDIYVQKYFDNENGYIESDKNKYVTNINESQYEPKVDEYNNVVTYVKKQ